MGTISRSIAFLMIILLMPIFLLISILSLIFQGFPIFFIQERIGKNFVPFQIFKFRTMKVKQNNIIKTNHEITGWGYILRKTKFDELPQLFNILKGEMRFVGPRPELKEFINKESFSFLNEINPGLSDYGSILFRNEEIILKNAKKRDIYYDILKIKIWLVNYYKNRKCFSEDFKLVILTLISILFPKYASNKIVDNILSKSMIKLYSEL